MTRARDLSEIVNSTGLSVDTDTLVVDSANNRVGIGTSSPSALLQLEGSDGTPQLKFLRTGTNIGGIIRQTSNPYGLTYDAIDGNAGAPTHVFRTSVDGSSFTERLRIDASGNAGLGVVPEAWAAFNPVLRIKNAATGGGGALAGSGVDNFRMFANTYYDGAYKRLDVGFATIYEQASGDHIWYSNDSGLADSTFTPTPNMKLDASGNLGIGTSTPSATKFSATPDGVLNLSGLKPVVYLTEEDETDSNVWMGLSNQVGIIGNTGAGLAFRTGASTATEAMRIDSAGLLMVSTSVDFASGTVDGIIAQGTNKPAAAFSNTAEGQIVKFYEGASLVGSIDTESGNVSLNSVSTGLLSTAGTARYKWDVGQFYPNGDNAKNLGTSVNRFKDLYLSGSVVHTFDVVNNGATDYQFSDAGSNWFPTAENDPVLYLRRGETYIFSVVATNHPFNIRVSNGGAAYNTGVTNNGAENGDVVFKVPMSAPATLYYQCTNHPVEMGNTINIV